MKSAPPTVPGMPSANSRPAEPALDRRPGEPAELHRGSGARHRAVPRSLHSSFAEAARRASPPRRARRASPTSTLEPPPSNITSRRGPRACAGCTPAPAVDVGTASTSAGPPMRNDVCRASGSSGRGARPELHTERARRTGAGTASIISVDLRDGHAGAHKAEQLVGALWMSPAPSVMTRSPGWTMREQLVGSLVARRARSARRGGRGAAAPGSSASLETPSSRLLAGRVDVRQHEHVGVVEGARKSSRGRACACSGAAGRRRRSGASNPSRAARSVARISAG